MLAIVAREPGPVASVLDTHEIDRPASPGPGEVIVAMSAATINPSDEVSISGAYASRTTFPFVPGFEGIGRVVQAGPEVPREVLGRRVLPLGSPGNWQDYKLLDWSWCVPVPEDIPDEVACFAYINPLTAVLMVDAFCNESVRRVAVTAANSTIGGHIAQLLHARGIDVIGIVRGRPAREVAEPELWAEIISTDSPGWYENLGADVDVVLDCVGGRTGSSLFRALRPEGVLVHYGLLSGEPLDAACFTDRVEGMGRRVEMFRLRDVVHSVPREELPTLFGPIFAHLRAGRLRTRVGQRTTLAEFAGVLARPHAQHSGKILVSIPGTGLNVELHG